MRKIPLGNSKKVALIDDEDFPIVSKYNWSLDGDYARTGSNKTFRIRLHQLIMRTPKGKHTDHINGNTLDNRRKNLRILEHYQNSHNTGIRIDNTSGFKGVSWNNYRKSWDAEIIINTIRYRKTKFKTATEAAKWRDRVAKKYLKNIAYINI